MQFAFDLSFCSQEHFCFLVSTSVVRSCVSFNPIPNLVTLLTVILRHVERFYCSLERKEYSIQILKNNTMKIDLCRNACIQW